MRKVFENIVNNKSSSLQSKKGSDFEDRFEESLKQENYLRLSNTDYKDLLDSIKDDILNKRSDIFIENNHNNKKQLIRAYFRAPYGSQDYPDFLVLTNNYIVPVEIKYSKNKASKPMWNSNLPKLNGIYLFGSYERRDVTFFAGKLVITEYERNDLLDFFEKLSDLSKDFKEDNKNRLNSNANYSLGRGFVPYPRAAFNQSKEYGKDTDINYFDSPERKYVEGETLNILSSLE